MSDSKIAERIKEAITDNGGYNLISEKTGISPSTLIRAATGKTEPKLKDVMKIADATGSSLNYIAYGVLSEQEQEATQSGLGLMKLISELMASTNKRIEALEEKYSVQPDPKAKQIEDITKQFNDATNSLEENLDRMTKPNKSK